MLRLLCLLVGLAATVNGACDTPFHQVGEGCYYFSQEYGLTMTWSESRQYCQSMGTDVDLVVMDVLCDDFGNLVNYILIADAFVSMGATYVGASGNGESFLWVDGRSLSVSSPHWYNSEPVGGGCVRLIEYSYSSIGYTRIGLYVTGCSSDFYFICQKNGDARN